ncbi:MAG: aminopeptidase P N-terminal domain-containing protein [Verrucomicrobia bacterium]|jgi:Xaa-Pro aminopeptidase|nr:aminopeptidase P N-terminal domain-containing protein [Verrucomicrobiota bacterium]
MKHRAIHSSLFESNRKRLSALMERGSLAVVNANDLLPGNADATVPMQPNSDLFYLTGVEQEESILLLFPDATDESLREILFVREPTAHLAIWEGHKLSKEEARKISGIREVRWLSEFWGVFHPLMCECEHVYLNSNEHKRAVIEVETRDARFVNGVQRRYPLHSYRRLARLMHRLRVVKSDLEVELIQHASNITAGGFRRLLKFVKPGVNETEIEAELSHEYIRNRAVFAYPPIIASGVNACTLHYVENDQECKKGQLVLIDAAARYANYNSDLTRTIPVNGRFTRRQKQVYNAVLRVFRGTVQGMVPGKLPRDLQKETEALIEQELVGLGLLKMSDVRKRNPVKPAFKRYFMHGVAHPLGLDTHDVGFTTEPIQAGWVMTCEPGIYIEEEGMAVRLENDILVTENGNTDLMADIPIEAGEIEELMNQRA